MSWVQLNRRMYNINIKNYYVKHVTNQLFLFSVADICRWCARSGRLVRCSKGLWRFGNVSVRHVIFTSVTHWSVIRQCRFCLRDVMVTSDWSSGIWYRHIHVIGSSVDTAITWSNGINHWHFLHFWCNCFTAIGTGLCC